MKKGKPDDNFQYSGFVLTFEPERTQWLRERIEYDKEFKESFSALDFKFVRRELMLLVLKKEPISISAIALMERMQGSGGSGKLKMRMTDSVIIDDPIQDNELKEVNLSKIVCTPETLKRIDSNIWVKLISEIKVIRPDISDEIDSLLIKRGKEQPFQDQSERVARLNEQRDALGLSLDIAQIDRTSVMINFESNKINMARSILDLLDSQTVQERSLIEHDSRIYKSLLKNKLPRSALFSEGLDREVRVYVTDKDPLETILGIDLIIYQSRFRPFLKHYATSFLACPRDPDSEYRAG